MMTKRGTRLMGASACALLAATLALPAAAQNVLYYTPQANIGALDPVVNTSSVTHQHSYMIYDTLFARDADFLPQPQMVDSYELSEDGRVYTMTLRDGLMFHDGTPVTATDAVASIRRWSQRDTNGRALNAQGMELEVVDDKTFTLTLDAPYGATLESLAKSSASGLFVFREQEALTDPATPITETIGSGPFTFVEEEFVPGDSFVYDRNDDYVPRDEPASGYAGGKVVNVDRVVFRIITDSNTAVSALQAGEIDFYETPPLDLLPLLEANPDIVTEIHNPTGAIGILRPNHLHPPFDDPRARQALQHMVDQRDYMMAAVGSDESNWRTCWAYMVCDSLTGTDEGTEHLQEPNLDRARELLAEVGYDGEPIVVLIPSDQQIIADFTHVTIQKLRDIGMNVEPVQMDWGSMLARRARQDVPSEGGWHITHTWGFGFELESAISNYGLTSACDRSGWPGWACDETTEELRRQWAAEGDLDARREVARKIQARMMEQANYVPLGQFFHPRAFRSNLTGIVPVAVPVFWNVEKN